MPRTMWMENFDGHGFDSVARGGVKAGARIARLVVNELFIFPVQMVPFAVRTVRYRSPNVESIESPSIEVYSKEGASDGPLVLYFHGGSWGQGAPWQYALLARRFLACTFV